MTTAIKMLAALGGSALAIGGLAGPSWGSPNNAAAHRTDSGAPAIQVEVSTGEPAVQAAFRPGTGQLVVDWNRELLKIEQTPGAQPSTVHPTRSFALLNGAIYDAVVSITHADNPYGFSVVAPRSARPDAAADQAAHDILAFLFPSFSPQLNQMLGSELAAIPHGAAKAAGVIAGERTATLLVALRADDGSATPTNSFVPGNQPGNYQLTPPNFAHAAFTNWGGITPWVLNTGDQLRPPPPPALSSPQWASAINEVQSLGEDSSTTRTADQTTIAKFWAPPIWNTWNEITDEQIIAHHSNLENASRLTADLNFALADSAIAFYDAKYHYQLWRPVTAIRAGTPNNPAVDPANSTWLPQAGNTAPDPSYPAAHSTISGAAATILDAFYGDHVELNVESDALPGVVRSFDSFQAAAGEAAVSRIYAGQHTRIDTDAGTILGHEVASVVLDQPFGTDR